MITSIVKHELKQMLANHKSWFCLAVIQCVLGIIFNWLIINFLRNQATTQATHYGITEEVIHPFYACFALLTVLIIPTLATQMICAEKQHGTITNYYCAPISWLQFIIGKFLSLNITLIAIIICISMMPLSIIISGAIDWGQYLAIIIGVYLMLTAVSAICLGLAVFMHNMLRANLLVISAIIFFILLEWAAQYAGPHALFMQEFGLLKPLKTFFMGVISARSLAYYALIIIIFMWLGSKSRKLAI